MLAAISCPDICSVSQAWSNPYDLADMMQIRIIEYDLWAEPSYFSLVRHAVGPNQRGELQPSPNPVITAQAGPGKSARKAGPTVSPTLRAANNSDLRGKQARK